MKAHNKYNKYWIKISLTLTIATGDIDWKIGLINPKTSDENKAIDISGKRIKKWFVHMIMIDAIGCLLVRCVWYLILDFENERWV